MRTPIPQPLASALTYLRALLASTDPDTWTRLKQSIKKIPLWDRPIAPRWRTLFADDWTAIPATPSPQALAQATRQHSIRSAFTRLENIPPVTQADPPPKLTLHFPTPRMRKADKRRANLKRKAPITREPLRGSDASGENANITRILSRCTPRRIRTPQGSTLVEEFLVQWDPEDCTLQEALTQQAQGFVITSIHSLDEEIPTPLIQAATAAKRPRGRPREADRLPPETKCRVQFAPSPQGPNHIRTIRGGKEALDAFLLTETKHTPEPPPSRNRPQAHTRGIQRHTTPTPPRQPKRARTPPHPQHKCAVSPLHRHVHHAAHTRTYSKSSRRRVTRTETPSLIRDHTHPSFQQRPHGTPWEQI